MAFAELGNDFVDGVIDAHIPNLIGVGAAFYRPAERLKKLRPFPQTVPWFDERRPEYPLGDLGKHFGEYERLEIDSIDEFIPVKVLVHFEHRGLGEIETPDSLPEGCWPDREDRLHVVSRLAFGFQAQCDAEEQAVFWSDDLQVERETVRGVEANRCVLHGDQAGGGAEFETLGLHLPADVEDHVGSVFEVQVSYVGVDGHEHGSSGYDA